MDFPLPPLSPFTFEDMFKDASAFGPNSSPIDFLDPLTDPSSCSPNSPFPLSPFGFEDSYPAFALSSPDFPFEPFSSDGASSSGGGTFSFASLGGLAEQLCSTDLNAVPALTHKNSFDSLSSWCTSPASPGQSYPNEYSTDNFDNNPVSSWSSTPPAISSPSTTTTNASQRVTRMRSAPSLQSPTPRHRLPAKQSMPALKEEVADEAFAYVFDGGASAGPSYDSQAGQSIFAMLGGYGGESQSIAQEWDGRAMHDAQSRQTHALYSTPSQRRSSRSPAPSTYSALGVTPTPSPAPRQQQQRSKSISISTAEAAGNLRTADEAREREEYKRSASSRRIDPGQASVLAPPAQQAWESTYSSGLPAWDNGDDYNDNTGYTQHNGGYYLAQAPNSHLQQSRQQPPPLYQPRPSPAAQSQYSYSVQTQPHTHHQSQQRQLPYTPVRPTRQAANSASYLTHTPLMTSVPQQPLHIRSQLMQQQQGPYRPQPRAVSANGRPVVPVRRASAKGTPRKPSRSGNQPFSFGETFINFTSNDAEKLLTGVAPSGSLRKPSSSGMSRDGSSSSSSDGSSNGKAKRKRSEEADEERTSGGKRQAL